MESDQEKAVDGTGARARVEPGYFAGPDGTVAALAALLRGGGTTAADLTERALEAVARLDALLGTFVTVDAEGARRAARQADEELAAGHDRGPLHGIPVAVKDIIDVAGLPTTAGAAHFAGHIAVADAECVRRLRAGGAVVVGKTTTHEFAYGPTGDRSATGPSRNPLDPACISGGSSGGSAAAVAAGIVPLALGTDTGGSVRIPAALCGVSGFKPAYGAVPTGGVFPVSASLDHVGVLARTPEDCRLGYEVLAGTAVGERPDPRTARVGWLAPAAFTAIDPEVVCVARAAVDGSVSTQDVDTRDVSGQDASGQDASAPVTTAPESLDPEAFEPEAFARDARAAFGAIQDSEVYAVHADRVAAQPDLYGSEVLDRLRHAGRTPGWRYVRALADRERIARVVAGLFDRHDLLALPTTPLTAPELDARSAVLDGARVPLRPAMLALTSPWNLLGLPALSVPAGTVDGMPVGLQLVCPPGREALLLAVAGAVTADTADAADAALNGNTARPAPSL
ncbi:amidase [Streptomyces sp. TS71-3]|uniref:amidase n=1 Tax=Streptomyces sp. TS71-3 TaxID=2733862 RepID=UPI001BB37736|nr:amidase [Streptomyces sp. TS71-3]